MEREETMVEAVAKSKIKRVPKVRNNLAEIQGIRRNFGQNDLEEYVCRCSKEQVKDQSYKRFELRRTKTTGKVKELLM